MFRVISKDRLVSHAMDEMETATTGWLNGPPQEEIALLSRITEQLLRRRRGCDVGTHYRVSFTPEVHVLHRQGPKTTDLYGCDLAVTLDIPDEPFLKTACFQLKRSESGSVSLDSKQLQAARSSPFRDQSFVLATDKTTGQHRLETTSALQGQSGKVSTSGWLPLSDWLVRWLDCQIGTPLTRDHKLEDLLRELFEAPDSRNVGSAWELPEGFAPLRVWVAVRISGG